MPPGRLRKAQDERSKKGKAEPPPRQKKGSRGFLEPQGPEQGRGRGEGYPGRSLPYVCTELRTVLESSPFRSESVILTMS